MNATKDFSPRVRAVRMLHTGDLLGDLVASCPILRSLGGGDIVISESRYNDRGRAPRETMRGARYEAIKPLLEAQPYVSSVTWEDEPAGITHDLSNFRLVPPKKGENLAERQARYLGVEIDLDPWLTVPNSEPHGRTVIARSLRYHNFFFPWEELLRRQSSQILFVGLLSEYAKFVPLSNATGISITYQPTKDLLELAQLIAGAKLFIGNQSCPFWIAAGLGVPLIQESFEADPNSIVKRDNATYTPTGAETRTLILRLYPKRKKVA